MNSNQKKITVIMPVFNEAAGIRYSVEETIRRLEGLPVSYELLLVDDGSKDETYKILDQLSDELAQVRFLSFSRNFGKESAVYAGLANQDSDAVVIMDCDLQHPPEVIHEMVKLWLTGEYDIIDAVKADRGKESIFYKLASWGFNKMMKILTRLDLRNSSDFKLLDRKVVNEVLNCKESSRFFRGLTEWVGFRHKKLDFHVADRTIGTTKWSFFKLLKYSMDNIISFSALPLKMISILGFMVILLSIALIVYSLVLKLMGLSDAGFTTVIIAVSFFSGTILLSLGVMGEYLSKIFDEIKGRPVYILRKNRKKE